MNCKPGDLARYIFDPEFPENEGAFVEVLDQANPNDFYGDLSSEFYWEVRCLTTMLAWNDNYKTAVAPAFAGEELAVSDRLLRPIRPDESPEESAEAMRRLHDTTVKQGEPA